MQGNLSEDMYVYVTPAGFDNLLLSSQGDALTSVNFINRDGQSGREEREGGEMSDVLKQAVRWLDIYFGGGKPDFLPPYKLLHATPFRQQVIDLLLTIPYGQSVSYGELAQQLAVLRGKEKMSARAVGQAVGWNPICIMIPCHRVLAADGRLRGYGGGIDNKKALLDLEGCAWKPDYVNTDVVSCEWRFE